MSDADHDPRNFELRNHTSLHVNYTPPVYFKNDHATIDDIQRAKDAVGRTSPENFLGALYHVVCLEYRPSIRPGVFSLHLTLQRVTK